MATSTTVAVLMFFLAKCYGEEMQVECAHQDTKDMSTWNCSDNGVYEFPIQNIHLGIQLIDFSYNHINHIPKLDQEITHDANCSGHLKRLLLHHNVIESLDDDTFQMLSCLEVLDLSYNHISGSMFTAKTLQGLRRLKTLNMRGNPLMVLKDAAVDFIEVGNLEYFDASHCQIETIETYAFDHLRFLTTLNLSNNSLTTLDDKVFRGLNFLHELDLSFNKFTHLDNDTFFALLALKHLHLDSNQILQVQDGVFHGLNFLEHLSLRENKLSKFPFAALHPLKVLKELDLSSNWLKSLTEFDGDDFLFKVETLKLEKMPRLRSIGPHATKIFPNLKYLHICNSHVLNNIEPNAFIDSFKSLQFVYINDNGLTTLDKDALPWKTLLKLDWSDNPWNCDCYMKWMISQHKINKSIICHTPTKFEGRDLLELHPLDLKCPRSLMYVLVGFSLSITLVLLASSVVIMWKYKHRFRCCRRSGSRYISVYTNEGAEEDAKATILSRPEDERPLTSDVNEND